MRQQNSHFYITPRFCGKNVKELSKLKIPASCSVGHFFFGVITSLPIEMRSIAMSVSVCLSVCLYVCPLAYLRNRTSTLRRIFFARYCGRGGSVLFWSQCDMLCTSGFVDDVIWAKCDVYDCLVLALGSLQNGWLSEPLEPVYLRQ